MEDNNISAPLAQAEAETQSPPVPAETTAVKVEVTVAGTVENLRANGGWEGGGEAAEDGGDGESGGVVGPEVTIRRKRGRPRKHHQLGSPDSSASPVTVSLGPKRGRGRPPGSGKLQMLASLGEYLGNCIVSNLKRTGCFIRCFFPRNTLATYTHKLYYYTKYLLTPIFG